MHASLGYRFLIFAISLLWLTTRLMAEEDEVLRNRFLTEAPHGWAQLRSILLHSKGRLTLSVRNIKPPDVSTPGYDEDVSFMLNGSARRRVESFEKSTIAVGCRNPQYTFHVEAANRATRVYRINSIAPGGPPKLWSVEQQAADNVWRISPLIYAPFAIDDNELAEIVKSTTFQLLSIRAIEEPQQNIEVRFRYTPPVEKQTWDVTLTLDPDNFWAVQHYRVDYPKHSEGLVFDCTLLYSREPFEGTPVRLPSVATVLIARKKDFDSGTYQRFDFTAKEFTIAEIPESEFTLSAFGLTEPGESPVLARRRSKLPLVLINVGAGFLILGIWYMRRRSAKNSLS